MQLQTDTRLQSRLADVLIRQLVQEFGVADGTDVTQVDLPRVDIEMECDVGDEPLPLEAPTAKFPREHEAHGLALVSLDERSTLPFAKYSTPYEKIEVVPVGKPKAKPAEQPAPRVAHSKVFDLDTVPYAPVSAPYDRIEIEAAESSLELTWYARADELTLVEQPRPRFSMMSLVVGAFVLGVVLGLLLFAI